MFRLTLLEERVQVAFTWAKQGFIMWGDVIPLATWKAVAVLKSRVG